MVAHGDRARPLHRARRGHPAVPADPGDGRRAGARADARRLGAGVHLVARGVRRAGPLRAGADPIAGRALAPGDAAAAPARQTSGVRGTLRTYGTLLRDRTFVGLVLVAGLAMSALLGLRRRLVVRVPGAVRPGPAAVRAGLRQRRDLADRRPPSSTRCCCAASSRGSCCWSRWPPARSSACCCSRSRPRARRGLLGVLVPLWLVLFSVGLALPNAPAVALARHGETAGTAAALLGAVQFGVGALISPLVGVLGNDAVAMAAVDRRRAGAVAARAACVVVRPWRLADLEPAAEAVPPRLSFAAALPGRLTVPRAHREQRQERLRQRADRQRVEHGADADRAAEQPARRQHRPPRARCAPAGSTSPVRAARPVISPSRGPGPSRAPT